MHDDTHLSIPMIVDPETVAIVLHELAGTNAQVRDDRTVSEADPATSRRARLSFLNSSDHASPHSMSLRHGEVVVDGNKCTGTELTVRGGPETTTWMMILANQFGGVVINGHGVIEANLDGVLHRQMRA